MLILGATARDTVTGFEGTITGFAEYITGCRQWLVVSRKLKDDGDMLSHWVDEVRLEFVADGESRSRPVIPTGGPELGPKSTVKAPPPGL